MRQSLVITFVALHIPLQVSCTSVRHVASGVHDQCRNELVQSCQAIRRAEFQTARRHLENARALSASPLMLEKVRDLDQICRGAEALESGEIQTAAHHWMNVRDHDLRMQLVHLTSHQGMDMEALARARPEELTP